MEMTMLSLSINEGTYEKPRLYGYNLDKTEQQMTRLQRRQYQQVCSDLFNALIFHYGCIKDDLKNLDPEFFQEQTKRDIFQAIQELNQDSYDILEIADHLDKQKKLTPQIEDYLLDIGKDRHTFFGIPKYVDFLRQYSRKRRLYQYLKGAYDPYRKDDYPGFLQAVKVLYERAQAEDQAGTNEEDPPGLKTLSLAFEDLETSIREAKKNPEEKLLTGYQWLDEMTYFFKPGSLTTIAAKPSVGKTTFCINLIYNALRTFEIKGDKESSIGIVSLETQNKDTLINLIALKSKAQITKIRDYTEGRKVCELLEQDIKEASDYLKDKKLILSDDCCLYLEDIVDWIKKAVSKHKIKFVVIDHLQLIKSRNVKIDGNLNLTVGNAARELKKTALALNICIVVISQLNRRIDNRAKNDKEPEFADLRDSGGIEQDSDVVLFMTENPEYSELVNFHLKKSRWGRQGEFTLNFNKDTGVFR